MFVLVLLCSFSIQVLHRHHYENKITVATHQDGKMITTIADHCKVCDQIRHVSSFDLYVPDITIASPITATPAHGGRYYIGYYKFTIQGFTNKGPPVAVATV